MKKFSGHLVGQAWGVIDLDGLVELVKVHDWYAGEEGLEVRPRPPDYLFWGAANVSDPRLVPYEVVPGRNGEPVEQPLRDPVAFLRSVSEHLSDAGQAVVMVSGWEKLELLLSTRLTVNRQAWAVETLFSRPGRTEPGGYTRQEGRFS